MALKLFGLASWQQKALGPTRPAALLSYLAYRQTWVSREALELVFYPEASEAQAGSNLRQLIKRSKQLALEGSFELEAKRLRFLVATDVQAFREAIGRADWQTALELYDDLLLGFEQNLPSFDTWLDLERSSLRQAYHDALRKQLELLEHAGNYTEAIGYLRQHWQQDKLAEDLAQRLMRCLYLNGQRQEALQVYARLEQYLAEELGLSPLEESRQLLESIRRQNGLPQPSLAQTQSISFASSLVGRAEVIEELQRSVKALILLSGEAGMGKTALLQEVFPKAINLQGQEGLETVPYYPLIHLLKTQPPQSLDRVQREVLAHFVPEIFAGLPEPLNALTGKTRILNAWLAYLRDLAPNAQYPLVVDNAQWLDQATLECLIFALHQGSLRRLLLAYRNDELPSGYHQQFSALKALSHSLQLAPLDVQSVQELLAALSQQTPGPPHFAKWLQDHSGGNPLFIQETLRHLHEQGLLNTEGLWYSQLDTLSDSYREFAVPERISQLVLRRFESLSEACQRLLSILAVEASLAKEDLKQLSGLSLWALGEALSEAERRGFLQSQGFRHEVLRQSIYAALTPGKRQWLHSQIAERLAQADTLRMAWHYLAAEQYAKSQQAFLEVSRQLNRKSRFDEAQMVLSQALKRLSDYVVDVDISTLKAELAFTKFHLATFPEAKALAQEILNSSSEADAVALAHVVLAYLAIEEGQLTTAQTHYHEAASLPHLSKAIANYVRWLKYPIFHGLGRSSEIIAEVEAELKELKISGQAADYLLFLANRSALYDQLGQPAKAFEASLMAIREAKRLRSGYYQQVAALNLTRPSQQLGRLAEATASCLSALAQGSYAISNKLRTNLAILYEMQGQHKQAYEQATLTLEGESNPWVLHSLIALQVRCSDGSQHQNALDQLLASLSTQSPAWLEALSCLVEYGQTHHQSAIRLLVAQLEADKLEAYPHIKTLHALR